MTSHRPPPPARTPRVVWVIAFGAAVGIVGPPVVALAQTVAPQVAAQTALAWPEQTPEPVGHGGLGGPLVIPSIGVVASEPPVDLQPTADGPSALATPRPSQRVSEPLETLGGSTDTHQAVSGALSDAPAAATGTPVETTTPPTTTEAAQTTTEPEPTDTSEPTTEPSTTASDSPTETTATTEETDVTGTSEATP